MKYKIIENSWIPGFLSWFINIWAITLYPYIICRGKLEEPTRTHEIIHLYQQRELWIIGFYVLYVWYWLKGLVKTKSFHDAYMTIPFEREAYFNENTKLYPVYREKHAWKKYFLDEE